MSSFTEGQVHQLMESLEKAGWAPGDITRLGQFPDKEGLRRVLHGLSEITQVKHLINLDVSPFIPDGWKVKQHIEGGQFEWSPEKVKLYLSPNQQDGKIVEGNELRKELEGKPVFNANLLDYLLEHPNLIPEEWKRKYIFFWGTIYHDSDGDLGVRCLGWGGGSWSWSDGWLGYGWDSDNPALVPAD